MGEDDLRLLVDRHDWRLEALDQWRKETDKRVSVLESKVHDLEFTNEVADALAKRIAEDRRRLELTVVQKIGAGLFALALVIVPTIISKVWT